MKGDGNMVRVYEEPSTGTNEVEIAGAFHRYQETLKSQNRLVGKVFTFKERDWATEIERDQEETKRQNESSEKAAVEENRIREENQQRMDEERNRLEVERTEQFKQTILNYEISQLGFKASLGVLFCFLTFCCVILFLIGLFWNVTCAGAGSVLCNFVIFPTVVFECMFVIKYTRREKLAFAAHREVVVDMA